MENNIDYPDSEIKKVENESVVSENGNKGTIIGISIAAILLFGGLIAFAIFLLTGNAETTEKIRDVFIIFMALESMVIGLALIILIIQLAQLTNVIQNEIKPILDSTQKTINTLRGTSTFLSDNVVEPVIKLNQYLAGLQALTRFVRPAQKSKKKQTKEN